VATVILVFLVLIAMTAMVAFLATIARNVRTVFSVFLVMSVYHAIIVPLVSSVKIAGTVLVAAIVMVFRMENIWNMLFMAFNLIKLSINLLLIN
jgi:uncharacterized membrane protein